MYRLPTSPFCYFPDCIIPTQCRHYPFTNEHTPFTDTSLIILKPEFGRYIAHLGPQTAFPVPEGILNYKGANTVAVMLWATQPTGARISPFKLTAGTPVLTGRRPVVGVTAPVWERRVGAY